MYLRRNVQYGFFFLYKMPHKKKLITHDYCQFLKNSQELSWPQHALTQRRNFRGGPGDMYPALMQRAALDPSTAVFYSPKTKTLY